MRTKKGFSLVELLVVIAIIGVLAGYTILRLVDNRYDVELTSAGNIIQSTVIKTRDMARAPQQEGDISDDLVVNGYGIQFPLVGATDIVLPIFRDTIDKTTPENENKFSSGDVNVSTAILRESDIANVKVLKYIYYDINNVMSEDTDTADARDIVFNSKETPTSESVYYNQNNIFTKVGISLQHIITKKEVIVWINTNGDVTTEGL